MDMVTFLKLFKTYLFVGISTIIISFPSIANARKVDFAADGFLLGSQMWISIDKGFFTEEGIEAGFQQYGTGIEAIQAVIAGAADIGPALDFAVLNLAASAKENMKVVAGIAAPKPGWHKLAMRNDLNSAKDLRGKKIGYVKGTSEHFVTLQHLIQNGVNLNDVELVPLPGLFELVGALLADEIQASWIWANAVKQIKDSSSHKIVMNDSKVLDTVAIYLVAKTSWVNKNQKLLESILRSYNRASKVIQSNPNESAAIIARSNKGNDKVFKALIQGQGFNIAFTPVMLNSFDSIAQFLIDSGKLPSNFNIRSFLDLRAMKKAVPGSVTANL
jgi:ABC-type nitrate/sulfonate/bicarbonate transport system substrate-binding protein